MRSPPCCTAAQLLALPRPTHHPAPVGTGQSSTTRDEIANPKHDNQTTSSGAKPNTRPQLQPGPCTRRPQLRHHGVQPAIHRCRDAVIICLLATGLAGRLLARDRQAPRATVHVVSVHAALSEGVLRNLNLLVCVRSAADAPTETAHATARGNLRPSCCDPRRRVSRISYCA